MELNNLWDKLDVDSDKLEIIKLDLSEGKVPELPYFVINQTEAKAKMLGKLETIDGDRMQTSLIRARYGNGKTNMLKYLDAYFNAKPSLGVKVLYSRANVDQTDIFLFLLQFIQDNYLKTLIEFIEQKKVDIYFDKSALANNFNDNFASIQEYVEKLFDIHNDHNTINEILLLGTGRLYSKGNFNKHQLAQLTNFNRREVLVLFLNILASEGKYIIFAIDELEKIHEKSSKRLNHFLTSYRELIDLFNKIKGHYLITCFTDATDAQQLKNSNEAFYSRIDRDVINIETINDKEDLKKLTGYLNELLGTNKNTDYINSIVTDLVKKNTEFNSNRTKIQYISLRLYEDSTEYVDLESYFKDKPELQTLYEETKKRLEIEDLFKNINQGLFFPLEYYLEASNFQDVSNKLHRRGDDYFEDIIGDKIHLFLFNENRSINDKLSAIIDKLDTKYNKAIIYAPVDIELSNNKIDAGIDVQIVDYNPKEFFTLLTMFRENFEKQDEVAKLIQLYTKSNL